MSRSIDDRTPLSPVATLCISAVATAVVAEPVRRLLLKRGRVDIPNYRSSHSTPVPRGGGIAALVGSTAAALATRGRPLARQTLGITALAGLGWIDDTTGNLPPRARLMGQLAIGSLAFTSEAPDRALAAITTAGVVNVVNFMDGINGISGLTAALWGTNAMLLSANDAGQLAQLGALTAGAGLGFLPHNLPLARLFLGDVGSYAFGSAIAAGILSQETLAKRYRVGAPLLLYAADASQALVRRARAGQHLTEAHREHIYQRLVDEGRTHTEVCLLHSAGVVAVSCASRFPGSLAWVVPGLLCGLYIASPGLLPRPAEAIRLAPSEGEQHE